MVTNAYLLSLGAILNANKLKFFRVENDSIHEESRILSCIDELMFIFEYREEL